MTLATVDSMGKPHARIVLLKGQDGRDFKFYTNYLSHKGEELTASPQPRWCFGGISLNVRSVLRAMLKIFR